ncbi:MAG: MFS transporter [Gammaproteobacteria bacterium]|nr:MFS transporter [Gammaproteobacteria bacterium]
MKPAELATPPWSNILSKQASDANVSSAPASKEKRADMTVLLFGLITYGIGQSLLYVVLGPIIREIGITEVQYGFLISASNVAIVLTAPWWGRKSETLGRKSVLIIGMLGYSAGYALLAYGVQLGMDGTVAGNIGLANDLQGSTGLMASSAALFASPLFLLLLGARLAYGALASAIQPAATAYIADTTDEAGRTKGMALVGMTAGLGTIIGPVFGVAFTRLGQLAPMYIAAALAVVAAICIAKLIKEPKKHVTDDGKPKVVIKVSWLDKRVFPYLLGWAIGFMIFTAIQPLVPLLATDQLGLTDKKDITDVVGVSLLSMGLVNVIVMISLMQKIKLAPPILLRIAFILFGLVLLLLTQATSPWMFYLAFGGMGFAFSMVVPSLNAGASLAVNDDEQGAVAGLLTAAPTLGMIFGPFGGTALYQLGPNVPVVTSAVISILLGLYFFLVKPSPTKTT